MTRTFTVLIFFACSACAFATYPLELVETIQLPLNVSWDVQHWMDDSTYGWACASGTTILYRMTLDDSTAVVEIPTQVPGAFSSGPLSRVVIFRSELYPDEPTVGVTWRWEMSGFDWGYERMAKARLLSGTLFGSPVDINAHGENGICFFQSTLVSQSAWPQPPSTAIGFVTSHHNTQDCYPPGEESTSWSGSTGVVSADSSNVLQGLGGMNVSVISRYDSIAVATAGHSVTAHYPYTGDPYTVSIFNYRRAVFGQPLPPVINCSVPNGWPCSLPRIATPRDSAGNVRVVLSNGDCRNLLNIALLWQNTAINGNPLFAGRMIDSPNERVLSRSGTHFNVYDAATGNFLDSTDPLIGEPQYLLKQPNRVCEIVTYETATRVVRIYRSLPLIPAAPENVAVTIDNVSHVLLHWRAVTESVTDHPIQPPAYVIHEAELGNGPFYAFAVTQDTFYVHEDILNSTRRHFYQVTAVSDLTAARALLLHQN